MNHDLGGLSRWIKGKEKDQRSVTLTDNNHIAATRQEAINLIKNYWTRIWEKQTAEAPSAEEIATALTNAFPAGVRAQEIDWTESTEGQLLQACASAKGTAGPDGWSSAEVRQLPPGVVAVFHKVSIRWLQSGLIPDTLRQAISQRQQDSRSSHRC